MNADVPDDVPDDFPDDFPAELLNAPVRFWQCPNREHAERGRFPQPPVVTVEWRGGVAHCTAPGCEQTSAHRVGAQPATRGACNSGPGGYGADRLGAVHGDHADTRRWRMP